MTLSMWLSICTFLQNLMALPYSVFELWWLNRKKKKKKMMNKLPIIAPYIYNTRYHAHPYILSITVLSDLELSSDCPILLSIRRATMVRKGHANPISAAEMVEYTPWHEHLNTEGN